MRLSTHGSPGIPQQAAPPPTRKTALIIWGALFGGALAFAVVAVFVGRSAQAGASEELGMVLGGTACGLSVLWLIASFAIPRIVKPAGGVPPNLLALNRTIIASALNEGGALFGVVAWMATASPWAVLAFATSVGGLLRAFPSVGRWKALGGGVDPSEREPNRLVR